MTRTAFTVFVSSILVLDGVSAGLLQSIREAAALRDSLQNHDSQPFYLRDARALPHQPGLNAETFQNVESSQPSYFDQSYKRPVSVGACAPGDFLCLAQKSLAKSAAGNEMSNAIVTTVASIMTEMFNSSLTRGLLDIIAHGQQSKNPQDVAEARAAMTMVTNTLSVVSGKVIQAVASFVKSSVSGVMKDLYNNVVEAARRRSAAVAAAASEVEGARSLHRDSQRQGLTVDNVNPSGIIGNALKRMDSESPSPPPTVVTGDAVVIRT